jgi:hypothetical protein
MKIEASRPQHHPARNLIKDWLFTLNLFFILYSLVMLAQFMMGPESGRVSTLVCKPDPWGKKVCTVKIYGAHKLFRLDFYADDYMRTDTLNNFDLSSRPGSYPSDLSLPWSGQFQASSSAEYVCAVSIRIQSQVVDFVPPYQKRSACSRAQKMIEQAFAGDRSAIDIRFNGINPNLYWRVALLGIASLLFLAQCAVRLRDRRRQKNALLLADDQPNVSQVASQAASGRVMADPSLQPAGASLSTGLGRKRFVLFWWAATALVFAFWVFSSFLNQLIRTEFWMNGCFLNIHDYQKLYLQYPVTNLLCILPLIILTTLGAVLQWQLIRTEVPVSRWWMAAPTLAGIPLLLGVVIGTSCTDCSTFGYPVLLIGQYDHSERIGWWVIAYFLVLGGIQWLVLWYALRISIVWSILPLAGALVADVLIFPMVFVLMFTLSPPLFIIVFSPLIILVTGILSLLAAIFSLVSGFYLHRAIRKRQTSLVQPVAG